MAMPGIGSIWGALVADGLHSVFSKMVLYGEARCSRESKSDESNRID